MIISIWVASILILSVIIIRSYRVAMSKNEFAYAQGLTTGDVLRSEINWMREEINRVYDHLRPYIARILMSVGAYIFSLGRSLYGSFSKKVFGRMHFEHGTNASFFVKHIREFKQELREERLD